MGNIDRFRVPRDSRFLLVPSQNASLEPLAIETYKFDLRSFHRAELRPLTKAIKRPPNCKHLTTYIIYLLNTAVFTILEQGPTRTKTTFVCTELPYHCR